jgi:hypothetical protein
VKAEGIGGEGEGGFRENFIIKRTSVCVCVRMCDKPIHSGFFFLREIYLMEKLLKFLKLSLKLEYH